MSIALDAMGGDHAPEQVVQGALEALPDLHHPVLLVGDPSQIHSLLPHPRPKGLIIHPASQVVGMEEKPMEAWRTKKHSSIAICADLVKEGKAQVMVSAGNTGAVSAFSLLTWRQMPGVRRPAIASPFPNKEGGFVLLDAGASPDVSPEHFVEFALMGRAYAQDVMGRPNPQVHLLNIGEEEGKGNAFAKHAYELLSKYQWFTGNIEGRDLFHKKCDVVVCDAFVGNIVLKTCEGVGEFIMSLLKERLPKNKLARIPFWPLSYLLSPLKKRLDYAEYGGSPLLGLNGLCIVCHGRSSAKAIKNALLLAQKALDNKLIENMKESLQVLVP